MGGDHAPRPIVDGAVAALRHLSGGVRLIGPRDAMAGDPARHGLSEERAPAIVDALEVVAMDEPPGQALRRTAGAAIRIALRESRKAVRRRCSPRNTARHGDGGVHGARTDPRRRSAALATTIPTKGAPAVLLDAGANSECRPAHLLQFAVMGAAYAQVSLGCASPRVGLLSIGEEATKGNDLTREAHRLLKDAPVHFIGNVEARDIYAGVADVIVCDGFTGNVVLKTSESLVDMVETRLGQELSSTFSASVGYLLSQRAFRRFRRRVDYSEYGGAPLLGVNGVVVVGHGRSSAKAVRNAILLADRFSREGLVARLERGVAAITVNES